MNRDRGLRIGAMVTLAVALLVALLSILVSMATFVTVKTRVVFSSPSEVNVLLGIARVASICAAVSMVAVVV